MNHNQLPWCRCHNEKTLHYFFRETAPSVRTGKTRKQLMTACHECGSPGNQAVKKTPEMRQDWLDSLPVLSMDEYQDYRYWNYNEPRPYTVGSQLNKMERPLHEHIARIRKDRRTHFGMWFLYEESYEGRNKFWHDPFGDKWSMIKYGDIKFPKNFAIEECPRDIYLIKTGLRRAAHAKHPHTLEPIFENPEATDIWYPEQYYYRRDPETKYVSYLVVIFFNEDYLLKIELDLEHVINSTIQTMLKIIPEWTGKELPLTPAEEIAEAKNTEAEHLDELIEDACVAAGTGEFANWHFDPEIGDDE